MKEPLELRLFGKALDDEMFDESYSYELEPADAIARLRIRAVSRPGPTKENRHE